MSDYGVTLSEFVYAAVNDWLANHGGGVATNAVFVIESFDAEGSPFTRFFTTPGQEHWKSLGLLDYGSTYYRQCVSRDLSELVWPDDDDGDDGE